MTNDIQKLLKILFREKTKGDLQMSGNEGGDNRLKWGLFGQFFRLFIYTGT